MYTAYPAKFTPDSNGTFLVTFPDVPETATDVIDKATANDRAAEALAVGLSLYVESGRAIPAPSVPKRGQILIHLAAGTVAKLALYQAMKARGITQVELARRLGVRRRQAAKIVDPAFNTTPEVLEAALAVVIDDSLTSPNTPSPSTPAIPTSQSAAPRRRGGHH